MRASRCSECVQQSVRHRPQCPVCKAKVGRRDVSGDDTMDRVVQVGAGWVRVVVGAGVVDDGMWWCHG